MKPILRTRIHPALAVAVVLVELAAAAVVYRFRQVNREIAELRSELMRARSQIAALEPLAARAHDMPVEIHNTRSRRFVMNQSERSLPLEFTVDGKTVKSIVLPPRTVTSIPEVRARERLEIATPGFNPLVLAERR